MQKHTDTLLFHSYKHTHTLTYIDRKNMHRCIHRWTHTYIHAQTYTIIYTDKHTLIYTLTYKSINNHLGFICFQLADTNTHTHTLALSLSLLFLLSLFYLLSLSLSLSLSLTHTHINIYIYMSIYWFSLVDYTDESLDVCILVINLLKCLLTHKHTFTLSHSLTETHSINLSIYLSIYLSRYIHRYSYRYTYGYVLSLSHTHTHIGLMIWVFANGPGEQGSIPAWVILKTQKMVLDATLVSTQPYKVRIKGKVEQSWKRSSALSPTPRCSSYWKESLRVTLRSSNFLFLWLFWFLCTECCHFVAIFIIFYTYKNVFLFIWSIILIC